MEQRKRFVRTRGLPQTGGPMLLAAIALLAVGAILLLVSDLMNEYSSGGGIWMFILTLAGCALLFFGRGRVAAFVIGGLLLFLETTNTGSPLPLAMLAWLISVVGVPGNPAPSRLPGIIRLPVWNLVSGVLALLALVDVLGVLGQEMSRTTVLRVLTVLVMGLGMLLLNLAVRPQVVAPAGERLPRCRVKSLFQPSMTLRIGAALLVVDGVISLWQNLRLMGSFDVPLTNFLWTLLILAAGILLLLRDQLELHSRAALILLLVVQLREALAMRQVLLYAENPPANSSGMLLLAAALMLIACFGVRWNTAVSVKGKARPVLNLIALAAAAVGLVIGVQRYAQEILEYTSAGGAAVWMAVIRGYLPNILAALLLPLGLILLNLTAQPMERPGSARTSRIQYQKGLTGLVQRFYSNVGGCLQMLAKIQGVICLVCGLICLAVAALGGILLLLQLVGFIPPEIDGVTLILSGLLGVLACVLLAVLTWPLYAFGQITSDVHAMKAGGGQLGAGAASAGADSQPARETAAPRPENPDELPEL